jgi:AcrR family transcriptional regulator
LSDVTSGLDEPELGLAKHHNRVARRQVDKFAQRREHLAAAALQTLAEQGYARTSLRDIAQNSSFSHGVLHYYFADKFELITYCVRKYKATCVTRYDAIMATVTTADELLEGIGAAMAATLREDAPMHRLWYDLRNQAMFEEAFRADAQAIDESLERMVWRILTRFSQLRDTAPAVTPAVAYAIMDGVFNHALLAHLSGDETAIERLELTVRDLMPALLMP